MTHSRTNNNSISRNLKQPSLKVNAVSNWCALIVNILVGFLLTPFIINRLGKTGYGIWILIGSFVGYYNLLDLGVRSALIRYVARYVRQADEQALTETTSTAMSMFCCIGGCVIAASFLFAGLLAEFFDIAPENYSDFKSVVLLLGLAAGLTFPSSVFGTIVMAHERYVAANFVSVISALMRAGMTVLLLVRGKGLVGVASATLVGAMFGLGANYLIFRYLTPWIRISFARAKWGVLWTLLSYGGLATVIKVADIMRMNLDSFVIGKLVGIAEVGIYGIAALIIRYILRFIATGMGVLTPRFAALDGANEHSQLQDLFVRSLSVSALLSFGCAMLAVVFGGRFIVLWVGEGFEDAIPVLLILASAYGFALAQNPAIGLMYALNKHSYYAAVTILEAIANLVISILLAPRYGIIGVALGTAIPMLIVKLLVQPIYVCRIINMKVKDYAIQIVLPAVVALVIAIIAYKEGMMTNRQGDSLIRWTISAFLCGITYVVIMFALSKQNRLWFKQAFSRS